MNTGDVLREKLTALGAALWSYETPPMPKGPWLSDDLVVATDGHILLAVPRLSVPGDWPTIPTRVLTLLSKWQSKPQTNPHSLLASQLHDFAGVAVGPCSTCESTGTIECEDCDGAGEHDCECTSCGDMHERECGTCRGKGGAPCPDCKNTERHRAAKFLGSIIDRNKLCAALEVLGLAPDVAVLVSQEQEQRGLYVLRATTGEWFALVMGLSESVIAKVDFDRSETWLKPARIDDAVATTSRSGKG